MTCQSSTDARRSDRRLILASASPYKRELLERLGIAFETVAADVDETPRSEEDAVVVAGRLALAKATVVAEREPGAVVIGCDQTALCAGRLLGKPGTHERAVEQLMGVSGRSVEFYTAVCVLDGCGGMQQAIEPVRVDFRSLNAAQVERYLRLDQPYNCAGSFKSERLGIALLERLDGDDPTALIGLPLIRLTRMLEAASIPVV